MKWKTKAVREKTNVGEQLKKARNAKGFSRYKVATVYCIPKSFLDAVEQNRFGDLPDTVYTRGMLKKYLRVLGLSTDQYLPLWEEAHAHWEALSSSATTAVSEKEIKRAAKPYPRWYITPALLQKASVVILALALIGYIGIRLNTAFAPASLTIITPADQTTTSESSIAVVGQTEPEVQLRINRLLVTVEEDGSFEETVTLKQGLNILEIEATKRYRPPQTLTRHILVIDPQNEENSN